MKLNKNHRASHFIQIWATEKERREKKQHDVVLSSSHSLHWNLWFIASESLNILIKIREERKSWIPFRTSHLTFCSRIFFRRILIKQVSVSDLIISELLTSVSDAARK